jgi:hypothetical protein
LRDGCDGKTQVNDTRPKGARNICEHLSEVKDYFLRSLDYSQLAEPHPLLRVLAARPVASNPGYSSRKVRRCLTLLLLGARFEVLEGGCEMGFEL